MDNQNNQDTDHNDQVIRDANVDATTSTTAPTTAIEASRNANADADADAYADVPASNDASALDALEDDDEENDHVSMGCDDIQNPTEHEPFEDESIDSKFLDHDIKDLPPDVWRLPAHKDDCTLEEIRRGQVINMTAANECPVYGCGKKINENVIDPSPGTIASGLRTHVLFVHYNNRKSAKKRKLGWSGKRKSLSPRKPLNPASTTVTSRSNLNPVEVDSTFTRPTTTQKSLPQGTGSLLTKIQQIKANKLHSQHMMSLQSLMQATNASNNSPPKPKNQEPSPIQNNALNVQSSLFSILAGLTQQQQVNQNTTITPANQKAGSIDMTQASHNSGNNINNNNNRPVNSSLLSLLNEKISGSNVATSLQSQLKKTLTADARSKIPNQKSRQSLTSPANPSIYQNNGDSSFNNSSSLMNQPGSSILNNGSNLLNGSSFLNNSSSLLNGLCSGNGDNRLSEDNSETFNTFIESIAIKTNSNIGPAGVAEAKRIIEKFTKSLLCSSQTIADHYIAPFVGEMPQQKPEISPSDIILAYKMMHKSQP